MREFNNIINDIVKYLEKRRDADDDDYLARKAHFDKFQVLWRDCDYKGILDHIKTGIKQFEKKRTIFTQRYYSFLLELEKHFTTENAQDKQNRQTKFINAVLSNDISQIKKACNQDCYAVMNLPYDKSYSIYHGYTPLFIALKEKKYNSVKYFFNVFKMEDIIDFLREDSVLSILSKEKANFVFNPEKNYTLLHFSVDNDIEDILEVLLELGKNHQIQLNEKMSNQMTPLLLACDSDKEDTAIKLIRAGADVNLGFKGEDGVFNSPILFAIRNNNLRLVETLVEHGAKIDKSAYLELNKRYHKFPDKYREIYYALKNPYKEKKAEIIAKGPASLLFFKFVHDSKDKTGTEQLERNLIANMIASQLYSENDDIKEKIFNQLKQVLQEDDEDEKILTPLLTVMAMGCGGLLIDSDHKKPLRIVANAKDNILDLCMGATDESRGRYRSKNTIYIAGNSDYPLANLFHEGKHYSDKKEFGTTKIGFTPDLEVKKTYEEMKKALYDNYKNIPIDENEGPLTKIKRSFYAVLFGFNYEDKNKDIEILARVPEIFGYLGIKKGKAWFKQFAPELLEFYKKYCNPALIEYANRHRKLYIADPFSGNQPAAPTNQNIFKNN